MSEAEDESTDGESFSTESQDRIEVAALHGCWRALLERQLRLGFPELGLKILDSTDRPLLTAAESSSLVDVAQHKGTSLLRLSYLACRSVILRAQKKSSHVFLFVKGNSKALYKKASLQNCKGVALTLGVLYHSSP